MTDLTATLVRHHDLASDMLRHANLVTPDVDEQAGALLIAATVLIERQTGGGVLACAALRALLEPTLQAWTAAAGLTIGGDAGDAPTRH